MSSAAGSWFQRILVHIPGLYKKQPCGNFHPFWHRLCFCREHEYCGDWKGGILDLKTGAVYCRTVDAALFAERNKEGGQETMGVKCPDCGFEKYTTASPAFDCPKCGGMMFLHVWKLCSDKNGGHK